MPIPGKIAVPIAAPVATPPILRPADVPCAFAASSFPALYDLYASKASMPPLINVAPPTTPPATAPAPVSASPVPVDAMLAPPRFAPIFASPPISPVPVIVPTPASSSATDAEPIIFFSTPPVALLYIPFPALNTPDPRLNIGPATFAIAAADNNDVMSGASPPGRSFPALERDPVKSVPRAPAMLTPFMPSVNPSANWRPILLPSSTTDDTSIPIKAIMPVDIAVPIPTPISRATPATFTFPDPFHQSENGSATNSSQAILILPNRSAFFHSSVAVNSSIFDFVLSTKRSKEFIAVRSAFSTSGTLSVSQSSASMRYGLDFSPRDIFMESNAPVNSSNFPERLSIMISAISCAAPELLLICSVRSAKS